MEFYNFESRATGLKIKKYVLGHHFRAICAILIRYFRVIPNQTKPNNTEPKLQYLVNLVPFGRPLPKNIKWYYARTPCISLICDLFSVNGKEFKVGQENLYEDPCQDWLDLINKKLTSPNYPDEYDPNTICKWHLTTDKGNYISLDFERIYVSDKDNDYKCLNAF